MFATKNSKQAPVAIPIDILQTILEEVRALRTQFALWHPFENLEEYEHPDAIKRAYENALRQYPPHV